MKRPFQQRTFIVFNNTDQLRPTSGNFEKMTVNVKNMAKLKKKNM